jgi:hypothetical protein
MMNHNTDSPPWAQRSAIIDNINARIDHDAIDAISQKIDGSLPDSKRKLKGVYFDSDIAESLEKLKKQRVNVSGFVNDAVRYWLTKSR